MPPSPAVATEMTVPFELERNIIVSAAVNGRPPRPFILGTASRNTVTPEAAVELGITASTGDDEADVNNPTVAHLQIGNRIFEGLKFRVRPLSNTWVDRGSRPRVAGVIGTDILVSHAMRIDFRARSLTLTPTREFRPPAAAVSLPLGNIVALEGLHPIVITGEIDHVRGQFMVDTGFAEDVELSPKFENAHHLIGHVGKTLQAQVPTADGHVATVRTSLGESLVLGGITLTAPLLSVHLSKVPNQVQPVDRLHRRRSPPVVYVDGYLGYVDGYLGLGVLSKFITTIDSAGKRLFLEQLSEAPLRSTLHGTGLVIRKLDLDSFEVVDTMTGTSAERAGLRRGDRITMLNGRLAHDVSMGDFIFMSRNPATKLLAIDLADGRHIDLPVQQLLP
jgi:hypothetical protein